jgi:uncharacterized Zn finger protein
MRCSCPDYAGMCKHVAAAMYGIGNRLDSSPNLLFVLRAVNHMELIEQAGSTAPIRAKSSAPTIAIDDLGAIFDIEIGDAPIAKVSTKIREKSAAKKVVKKARTVKKASAAKKKTTTRVPKKG